jgi:hypothetical protein
VSGVRKLPLTLLLLATLVLCASALSACREPSVDDRFAAFLAAWQKADFTGIALRTPEGHPLDAATAKQTLAGVEGELAARRPVLTRFGKASVNHADALARVGVKWPLPDGHTWIYETTVAARKLGDDWQIYLGAATIHPDLNQGERLTLRTTSAPRGTVVAADGTPIVSDVPVVYVGLEPQHVQDVDAVVQRLDIVFRSVRVDVDVKGLPARLRAAKPDAFVDVVTLRKTDYTEIEKDLDNTGGVRTHQGTLSLPLTRTFGRALLGISGPATKELIDGSAGALKPGDIAGLNGLQRRYDTQLRGVPGVSVVPVEVPAASTGAAAVPTSQPPASGSPPPPGTSPPPTSSSDTGSSGSGPSGAGSSGGGSTSTGSSGTGSSGGGSSSTGSSGTGSPGGGSSGTSPSGTGSSGTGQSGAGSSGGGGAGGKAGKPLFVAPPAQGMKIETTIDVKTQQAAEAALARTPKQSALVAIRVSDGAVLAVANGPDAAGYDLALLGEVPSPPWSVDARSLGVGAAWRIGADVFTGRVTQTGVVASPIGYAAAAAALTRGHWRQPALVRTPAPGDAAVGPAVTGSISVPGMSVGVRGDIAYCVYATESGSDVTAPIADAFLDALPK